MARLGHCGSKQHHHLCHRNANGAIRIPSCQSFLHRTLRKQSVELATETQIANSRSRPHLIPSDTGPFLLACHALRKQIGLLGHS